MTNSTPDMQGVLAEAQKTKETAAKLANGDYPKDADHVRVLAGMIQKLAEQVAQLAGGTAGPKPPQPARGIDRMWLRIRLPGRTPKRRWRKTGRRRTRRPNRSTIVRRPSH